MDEAKWSAAVGPTHLLLHLRRVEKATRTAHGRRRLRLFGVACARRVWGGLTPKQQKAVEAVETTAEAGGRAAAYGRLWRVPFWRLFARSSDADTLLAHLTASEAWTAAAAWRVACRPGFTKVRGTTPEQERKVQAELVRCLFGDPFRRAEFRPGWRTATAVGLATGIYEERAFDRLPVLADALEEAGCDDATLLAHCRHARHHARGCRAVDAVLGRV